MNIATLEQLLANALKSPLPGFDGQSKMAPAGRKQFEEYMQFNPVNPRQSAVMLLFYPGEKEASVVMIKRPDYEGVHGGQIAFPGGSKEEADTNAADTALRETFEEVGIPPAQITLLGALTPLYIPPSNFMVDPIVGIMHETPTFLPDPGEVETILEIPYSMLTDESLKGKTNFPTSSGLRIESPYYDFMGYKVWGASAMILSELSLILRSES